MALDPVAGGLISTGINAAASFGAGAMNQYYSEQNALLAYRLGQKAQVNAAGNMVEGYKRAGLSPALVAGSNFSAAGGISGQGGNTPAPQVADLAAAANMQKQNELVDAQIRNVDAQTQAIQNKNTEWSDENAQVGDYAVVMAERWQHSKWYENLSEDTKDTIDAIADGSNKLTIGKMRALISTIQAQHSLSDAEMATVKNSFDAAILSRRFDDEALFNAELNKNLVQFNLTKAQISEIYALIQKHKAEIIELTARGDLNRVEVEKILASDVGVLIKRGDYQQLGKLKLNSLLDGITDGVTMMIPGAAVGKTLRGFTGRSANQVRRMNANRTFSKSTLMRLDHNSSAVHQINFGPNSSFHPNARF